jgi:RNA polymerase sigma-70 factor (family 1)
LLTETAYTQLLLDIAADDQTAYKLLFEHFYSRLHKLAFIITRSSELSEEVVSDVFISLWRNRGKAPEIQNLRVYLYVSTRNTALNYQKRMMKKSTIPIDELDVELGTPYTDPEQAFVTKEMEARIRNAIDALPPRCKMVFKLVKEDGLSYKEAAEVLGLSVGTIDNQLVIAVKRIASALFYRFSPASRK